MQLEVDTYPKISSRVSLNGDKSGHNGIKFVI